MKKDIIAVWFSCGCPSAVAAKKTLEIYGDTHTVLIINNPVKEEDSDNIRFRKDVEKWLGVEIISASNSKFPTNSAVDVWEKRKYMSGIKGAPCTTQLKKEARYQFEEKQRLSGNPITWHVLGFTLEEEDRHDRFVLSERDNVIPVLIDLGITRNDCFAMIEEQGIELPLMYRLKYPNANCIGCSKATSATYWNRVRETHPEVFNDRCEQSRRIGAKLVRYKGKRIFLDELPPDAKGRKMKSYECGIFCNTK